MDRRRFLQVMAAGAAGAALPRLVFARSDGKVVGVDFDALLAKAVKDAKAAARPLLVFVIPAEATAANERAKLLGRWLQRANEELLEDLALIDVACAPLAALHARAWDLATTTGEPCFVWVETHADEPVARALAVDPLSIAEVKPVGPPEPGLSESLAYDLRQRDRFDALAMAVRSALDWKARGEEYAQRAEALLDDAQKSRIAKAIAHPRPQSFPEAGRAAAYWRFAVRADAGKAERVRSVLARQAILRLMDRDPAGSEWFLPKRTAADLADLPCSRGPCGLPATTPKSREFLRFLTPSAK